VTMRVLGILILKRLRLNVLSLRFFYGVLLLFGLAVLAAIVSTENLKSRIQYVQARELEWKRALDQAQTYNGTYGQVILKPPTLSVVAEGIGDRFGLIARVFGKFGGIRVGGQAHTNRLLVFLPVDLAHVIGLVLTLLAILFTYDAISGERESGTLPLVLSHALPRRTLLVSESLAALLTLLIVLLPALFAWLLIVRMAGFTFGSQEWVLLLFFFLATILLLACYVAVGLLMSLLVRGSATALMLGLAFWVSTNSLYPSLAAWSAIQVKPVSSARPVDERTVTNQMIAQARLARNLQLLSPTHVYYVLASRIAGTDLEAYAQFLEYVRRYHQQVADWHREKLSKYPDRESRWSGFDLLDIEGFPQPLMATDSPSQKIASSALSFSLLMVLNGGLLLMTLLAINRYDPR
jgi:ABC-type transport system involved in multi-copper enzyme maturation permease subunit